MELFNKASTKDKRRALRKSRTEAEDVLWQELRARKIAGNRFIRQYGIGEYVADFYCPRRKLVIELDGSQHSTSDGEEYDRARESYMKSIGIKTVRFRNAEVLQSVDSVLTRIRHELTL